MIALIDPPCAAGAFMEFLAPTGLAITTPFDDTRVFWGEFMSAQAMSLAGVDRRGAVSPECVDLLRNRLKVRRVDAMSVNTPPSPNVVNDQAFRDRTNHQFVNKAMCGHGLPIAGEKSVPVAHRPCLPQPAFIRTANVYVRPKTSDGICPACPLSARPGAVQTAVPRHMVRLNEEVDPALKTSTRDGRLAMCHDFDLRNRSNKGCNLAGDHHIPGLLRLQLYCFRALRARARGRSVRPSAPTRNFVFGRHD